MSDYSFKMHQIQFRPDPAGELTAISRSPIAGFVRREGKREGKESGEEGEKKGKGEEEMDGREGEGGWKGQGKGKFFRPPHFSCVRGASLY